MSHSTSSTTHYMQLHPGPIAAIAMGEKKSELRVNDAKRRLLHVGELIVFTSRAEPDKTITTSVTSLNIYPTFRDLYRAHLGEFPTWKEDAFVESFSEYYSPIEELTYGVVRIGIALES